ncbi:MAG: PEP-utilizing enzyme [Candidatus Altiarchaeota archaeon]
MGWEIFERIYGAHWFLVGATSRHFPNMLIEAGNPEDSRFIGFMHDDVNPMVFKTGQFNRLGEYLADKLMNDCKWRRKIYSDFYRNAKLYFKAGDRLRRLDYTSMTGREIAKEAKRIVPLQMKTRVLAIYINGLPVDGRNHLSNRIRAELGEMISDDERFEEYWTLLTQVTKPSIRQIKDVGVAKLADKAKRRPSTSVQTRLHKIQEKYCWLDYMYYGPPSSFEQLESEYAKATSNNANLDLLKRLKETRKRQDTLMNRLKFTSRGRNLVKLAQTVLWQKGWRKDVEYHGFYCYEPLFKELAKRHKVEDWRTLLYMLPWELEEFILKNKPTVAQLKKRREYSCYIAAKDKTQLLTGERARKFYTTLGLDRDHSGLTEVKGQVAYRGKAIGRARIIHVPKDMEKMRDGDILVSQATSPDLIMAMKKAAAIVTNTGGLICHAAITARELKIPCVVGTRIATEVFKDGDLVEVDATKGTVKKLKA